VKDKAIHKEVAEILGISESTSKSQYNRAKKKLKEIILTNRKNERRA
jgi:DNA-directed RNA polymerase specialized sigma24 family protein